MSRLTGIKKTQDQEYYKVKKIDENWAVNIQNCINKLGKLEDLEEELGIDLLDLCEDFRTTKNQLEEAPKGYTIDYLAYTVSNGIGYNKLSKELGCPLEVVFKAIDEGVCVDVQILDLETTDTIERPRLYYSDDFKCYCFELLFGEYVVKLKDYQKTWWLKGERDE